MTSYTDIYEEQDAQTEEGSMSFLDHLDELRTRLMRIAIFVVVAFVVCWIFSDSIYKFLQIPVQAAMLDARRQGALRLEGIVLNRLSDMADGTVVIFSFPAETRIGDAIVQAGTTIPAEVKRASDDFPELVTTSPWAINTVTVLDKGYVIPRALYAASNGMLDPDNRLVVGTVQGAFNLYIKVSFYAAIFFGVPFILVQIWGFVSPGLYPHEKKYAAPIIVMASFWFLAGCAFAYYVAFPRAANFLLGVAAEGNLRPLVTADEYFDLIITIMLGLGVIFEIPTVTFIGARLGLISPGLLLRVWRLAFIAIFIIAAILSPTTDVPNLLVFAAPMLILYFLSVGIAWVFHRSRKTEAEFQELERK
jgi:sec-independent protein translocase protein TatC